MAKTLEKTEEIIKNEQSRLSTTQTEKDNEQHGPHN